MSVTTSRLSTWPQMVTPVLTVKRSSGIEGPTIIIWVKSIEMTDEHILYLKYKTCPFCRLHWIIDDDSGWWTVWMLQVRISVSKFSQCQAPHWCQAHHIHWLLLPSMSRASQEQNCPQQSSSKSAQKTVLKFNAFSSSDWSYDDKSWRWIWISVPWVWIPFQVYFWCQASYRCQAHRIHWVLLSTLSRSSQEQTCSEKPFVKSS